MFINKKKVLTLATAWINLENISVSKRSPSQQPTRGMILFLWNIQKRQSHRDTAYGLMGWSGARWGVVGAHGCRVFGGIENVLELDRGEDRTSL